MIRDKIIPMGAIILSTCCIANNGYAINATGVSFETTGKIQENEDKDLDNSCETIEENENDDTAVVENKDEGETTEFEKIKGNDFENGSDIDDLDVNVTNLEDTEISANEEVSNKEIVYSLNSVENVSNIERKLKFADYTYDFNLDTSGSLSFGDLTEYSVELSYCQTESDDVVFISVRDSENKCDSDIGFDYDFFKNNQKYSGLTEIEQDKLRIKMNEYTVYYFVYNYNSRTYEDLYVDCGDFNMPLIELEFNNGLYSKEYSNEVLRELTRYLDICAH